jgi:hypothetical protein
MNHPKVQQAAMEVMEELNSLTSNEVKELVRRQCQEDHEGDLDIHSMEFLRQT